MNRQETSRILAIVTSMYPAFLKDRDPKILADVWQRIFDWTPYAAVEKALYTFIASDTRGYPPTPGALNRLINDAQQAGRPTDVEAWGLVYRALTRSLYNSVEEFGKLPPEIRQIIGSAAQLREWSQLSPGEVSTGIASAFMRTYRARQEQERETVFLPGPRCDILLGNGQEEQREEGAG